MHQPTIGLEIHVELNTTTKMFCCCRNYSGEIRPNTNVCPICLGHPGTLPVANKDAILKVIRLGLALGSKTRLTSHFSRKSYFYPDLPKAYQITQYDEPLCEGGELRGVRIRRIHLEEDTGQLLHSKDEKNSLVDYNRAGVPLLELVTEPDLHSAEDATNFARELQLILRYIGVSNADMEFGEMRIEANVSLDMGTKVELKNINSFKAVSGAIAFELQRQAETLKEGKLIHQETRGWNEVKGVTVLQRKKESSEDYRYFPEPDLPPVVYTKDEIDMIRGELSELPEDRRRRFLAEFNLPVSSVNLLVGDKAVSDFYEAAVSELAEYVAEPDFKLLCNYLMSDLQALLKSGRQSIADSKVNPKEFGHLIALVQEGKLTSRLAKDLLLKMFETGEDPEVLIQSAGISVMTDVQGQENLVRAVLAVNPKAVTEYKNGKVSALQFLVGKVMAQSRGMADPQKVSKLLQILLK